MITSAPEALPVELFPLGEPGEREFEGIDSILQIRYQASGKEIVVEATVTGQAGQLLLIRQTWVEGEKWWREYERYVRGQKDLHARRATEAAEIAALQPPKLKPYPFPLRLDPKLRVPVTIAEDHPPLADMLASLRSATGLNLILEPALEDHMPDFGELQSGPKGWQAWQLMEMIQKRDLTAGRWRKIDGGYLLEGVSQRMRPPPAPPRFPWPWVWSGAAAVMIAAVAFLIYRRRMKIAPGSAKASVLVPPPVSGTR